MYALSIKENYMIDKLNEALAESLGDIMFYAIQGYTR